MKKSKPKRYRLSNWGQYNTALINRGSLTFWIDQDSLKTWVNQEQSGKPGASDYYSDHAITAILMIGTVMQQALRQTQGLAGSILRLLGSDLRVPNYTTLCRRRKRLGISLGVSASTEARDIVLDSTGLKVYGEGEWKMRQHGKSKRRRWLKVHIGIDTKTQEMVAAILTENDTADSEVVGKLLEQIPEAIGEVLGDGGYDTMGVHEQIAERGAQAIIPPRRGAKIRHHGNGKGAPHARDQAIRGIRRHGRDKWKNLVDYHRRSLVETMFSRLKRSFGDRIRSRVFESQARETFIGCRCINQMTRLGMPESYPVAV